MPRQSETGNVKKLCACPRGRRWSCGYPWYVDYKAAKDHPTRANDRLRKNLDMLVGRHAVYKGSGSTNEAENIVCRQP